jgi:hypothetical protein
VRAKVFVYRGLDDFRAPLLELVDPSQLPTLYGGTLRAATAAGGVPLNHFGQHPASGPPAGSPELDGASRPWLTYPIERAVRKAAHAAGCPAVAAVTAGDLPLGPDRDRNPISTEQRPGFQL